MKQSFAIGDIHGGLKALDQLLGLLPLQPNDRLVFLGDYVDGWSESAGVINRLLELEDQYDCIFLLGNHDAWCLQWLKTGQTDTLWLSSGGEATIASYANVDAATREQHLLFMEQLRPWFVDEDNNLFIHAGFCSLHGPAHDRYETNWYWDRTLWEMAIALNPLLTKDSPFYPKRLQHFNQLFIGHTPTTNYGVTTPIHAANLWNVDTGAAFRGKLAAINTRSFEFWQSEPVYSLYPNETGRTK
jgi:serine/threonine protein phosphatase 1